MLNIFLHELRLRRRSILLWGVALTGFLSIYLFVYPQAAEEFQAIDLSDIEFYTAFGFDNFGTFDAYIGAVTLNLLPIFTGLFGVIMGTQTLAGEEDDGTLELLAALPVKRWQLVIAKALALLLGTVLLVVMVAGGFVLIFLAIRSQIETDLTALDMFLYTLNVLPITVVFLMFGLLLGALLPRRPLAVWGGSAVAIASYFSSNLLPMVGALEDLNVVNPHNYYDAPELIASGVQAGDYAALLGAALVMFVLTLWLFHRRRLTTGLWFWQRGRKAAPSR